ATEVLKLNLAEESQFLYLNNHANRSIKKLLIYERVENNEESYDTVNTDIDQKIFEKLPKLKRIFLKNCTITEKRFQGYEKYMKKHKNLSFTIHQCVIKNVNELNFNSTFRIIHDKNQNICNNNYNRLASHDYLVYG
ncbi:11017_t:CDS:2, partial [Gigaspora margarita]